MPCQVRRLVKLGIDKRDPDALTADEIRSVSFALSHPSNHVECFFLHSYSYGSPLLESLPSWTSTRARSPGRGFWTPTTGRFDLYIVRKHKWQAWQQYCLSADTWERSLWDRARQRRVWPGVADFQMYHFMTFIFVSDLTNVLLQGDSVWHHCGQVK